MDASATSRPWWRRKAVVIPAAMSTVAVIVGASGIACQRHPDSNSPHATVSTSATLGEPRPGGQTTLTIGAPWGLAVDGAGDVFGAEYSFDQVTELVAGSSTPTVLPFTGLKHPWGVAVDSAGDVLVTDEDNKRVLRLAAGSSTQTVVPITGLRQPLGLAVDATNLYVSDVLGGVGAVKVPKG